MLLQLLSVQLIWTNNSSAQSSETQAEVYITWKFSPFVNNRSAHLQGIKYVCKYFQGAESLDKLHINSQYSLQKNSSKGIFNNL